MTTTTDLRKRKPKHIHGDKNEFGLDLYYFETRLTEIVCMLEDYSPFEIERELTKLAVVAKKQINE